MRALLVCAMVIALAGASSADTYAGFGALLDYQGPLDPEMYGGGMSDNAWGRDLLGISHSHGDARNQFYTWNRPHLLVSPGLDGFYGWDFGLSIHLRTKWTWLSWAPNRDVDIVMDRVQVPVELVPTWSFNTAGRVQPKLFAGGGIQYVSTHIFGRDLFDQRPNPNFDDETTPEPGADAGDNTPEPRRFFKDDREFGKSGWYPIATAGAGVDFVLSDSARLGASVAYSSQPMETVEAVLVMDGPEAWHWVEKSIEGDGGGIHAGVSIHFTY